MWLWLSIKKPSMEWINQQQNVLGTFYRFSHRWCFSSPHWSKIDPKCLYVFLMSFSAIKCFATTDITHRVLSQTINRFWFLISVLSPPFSILSRFVIHNLHEIKFLKLKVNVLFNWYRICRTGCSQLLSICVGWVLHLRYIWAYNPLTLISIDPKVK